MYPFPPHPSMLQRSVAWWRGEPLSLDFVKRTVDLCDQLPKIKAAVGGGEAYNALSGVRDSEIAWVPFPTPALDTTWLYNDLANLVVKLNEDYFRFLLWGFIDQLQYTVYDAARGGQHYGRHIDMSGAGVPQRKLSFSLLLSDPMDYDGGDFKIYGASPQVVQKEIGTLFVFPSYTEHEVTPVTKGIRRSLVGWVSGWDFR